MVARTLFPHLETPWLRAWGRPGCESSRQNRGRACLCKAEGHQRPPRATQRLGCVDAHSSLPFGELKDELKCFSRETAVNSWGVPWGSSSDQP